MSGIYLFQENQWSIVTFGGSPEGNGNSSELDVRDRKSVRESTEEYGVRLERVYAKTKELGGVDDLVDLSRLI